MYGPRFFSLLGLHTLGGTLQALATSSRTQLSKAALLNSHGVPDTACAHPRGVSPSPLAGRGSLSPGPQPCSPTGWPSGWGLLSTSCHGLSLICQVAATTHLAALPVSLSLLPPRPPHLGLSPTSLGAAWSASWTTPTQLGGVWSVQPKYRDTHEGPAGGYNLRDGYHFQNCTKKKRQC